MPIEAMENCNELFCKNSLHGLARRHFDLFGDVNFYFRKARWCIAVFWQQKTYEIQVNASITVKDLGRISIHVMAKAGNF